MDSAPSPVSIKALVEALELQTDSMSAFVNPSTGAVLIVSDEALVAVEAPSGSDEVDDEELELAKSVLATPGMLQIPSRFDVDEYHMMTRFADGRAEPGRRDALVSALRGSGAFRRFKDLCYALGLAPDWYAFRDAEYEAMAVRWCEAHGLTWT